MSFISYSQNFEDIMLWRALKNVQNGFYIDVGAAWPDEHSVTKAFYDHGWRGINIEPNPAFKEQYLNQRKRDINLFIALGDQPTTAEMYFVSGTGLSSLDKDLADKYSSSGRSVEPLKVEVRTLADVCQQYASKNEIHFLKIDVEGFELNVVKGNDWKQFRPWIVLVEATVPMSPEENHSTWEPLLLDAGYTMIYADGLNRFYLASERQELAPAFRYPPNVFDDFTTFHHLKYEAKIKELEEEKATLRRQIEHLTAQQSLGNGITSTKLWRRGAKLKQLLLKFATRLRS